MAIERWSSSEVYLYESVGGGYACWLTHDAKDRTGLEDFEGGGELDVIAFLEEASAAGVDVGRALRVMRAPFCDGCGGKGTRNAIMTEDREIDVCWDCDGTGKVGG